MTNGPLTFLIVAILLVGAMLAISYLIRRTARKQLPGSSERRNGGTHWFAHGRKNDDFDGDGDI